MRGHGRHSKEPIEKHYPRCYSRLSLNITSSIKYPLMKYVLPHYIFLYINVQIKQT
jgi:hypothetical protein